MDADGFGVDDEAADERCGHVATVTRVFNTLSVNLASMFCLVLGQS